MRPISPRTAEWYYQATHFLITMTGFSIFLATLLFIRNVDYQSFAAFMRDGSTGSAIAWTGIFFSVWMAIAKYYEAELGTIRYWKALGKSLEPFPQNEEERAKHRKWARDTLSCTKSRAENAASALLVREVEVRLYKNGEIHTFETGGGKKYRRELVRKEKALERARANAERTARILEAQDAFFHESWRCGAAILKRNGGNAYVFDPDPAPMVYA